MVCCWCARQKEIQAARAQHPFRRSYRLRWPSATRPLLLNHRHVALNDVADIVSLTTPITDVILKHMSPPHAAMPVAPLARQLLTQAVLRRLVNDDRCPPFDCRARCRALSVHCQSRFDGMATSMLYAGSTTLRLPITCRRACGAPRFRARCVQWWQRQTDVEFRRRLRPHTTTYDTRVRAVSEVNCAFASVHFP